MATIQPSGAGDGSNDSKWNTGSTASPWTNLPFPIYTLLGSKMDAKNIHAMRLACSKWRSNVEQHISLKVKVDDSIPGNLEFSKRVKIVNARILNWTVDIGTEPTNHLFQYPDHLKKLDLCGRMPTQWKIHNFTLFPNLAHLVLRNRALGSNNLTGHQYPVLTFDPISPLSLEYALKQAYETQEPPSEDQPIELKSLQTLEIAVSDYYCNPTTPQLPKHSYLVMMTNVNFLWSHIKAPLLSVVHIDMIGSMVTLHTFFNNHRTSLRQLFLPNWTADLLIQHENITSFPINLRKLRLNIQGPFRDLYTREPPIKSPFTYLQKFLDAQTQLVDVYFGFYSFPLKWTSDAFTSLANSCARTLRYIELFGNPNQSRGVLDLQMLSVCHSLEVLHLPWWGRSQITFRNLEKLPTSLKRLVIWDGEGTQVEIGDPNVFKRLTALEWLNLFGIRFQIADRSGNQEPQRQFCRTMVKGLLGLRKLEGYFLEVHGIGLNEDPSVVKMLSPFDKYIRPAERRRHTRTNFNFTWKPYSGPWTPWSDRPFHKETLDMEKDPQQSTGLMVMDGNEAGENANEEDVHDGLDDEDVDDGLDDEDVNDDLDDEDVNDDLDDEDMVDDLDDEDMVDDFDDIDF